MRSDDLLELTTSLDQAREVGYALSDPSPHLYRILTQFSQRQRKDIVDFVYEALTRSDRRPQSKRQFIRDALLFGLDNELEDLDATSINDQSIASIVNGSNTHGVAALVRESVTMALHSGGQAVDHITDLVTQSLGQDAVTPEVAVAISSTVAQNQIRLDTFDREAEAILAERQLQVPDRYIRATQRRFNRLIGRSSNDDAIEESRSDLALAEQIVALAGHLEEALPEIRSGFDSIKSTQTEVFRPQELANRFGFESTECGLWIPNKSRLALVTSLNDVLRAVEHDRSTLLNMSPRRFEEFLGELFERMGFDVELTAASRDGGADLLCLRDLHGIPFRLAVEVKRYKESRPITVDLVRSFVGANEEIQANRLLFVTTSRYTQPAVDYATNCVGHLLSLKDYHHIQDWCRDALQSHPTFFGSNANLLP